jgi:hypothetical protein
VTSSRHIPADADLTYFTVTCHLAPIVADLSQDSDYDPNTARIDAVVTFTPKYKAGEVIHSHTSTPPTGFLALPVTALIDDGYLKLRAKPDAGAAPLPGTLHGLKAKIAADTGRELDPELRALNYAPVRLLGNSTTLEIDPEIPLYYDFTFTNIKIDGKQTNYVITGGTFEAPWEDTVIDLLDWMPLSPGPYAQPMVVGPQGPPGEPGPATVNVGTTTTSLPGSDAQVSNAGDGVNAVFDFVIPRGDVGPVGPAGGLLEFDSVAAFPATGTTGQVYLAKDTGDTYRWDATAKALTYVRISERVASTGIEDSTEIGRAVVTAADAQAGRLALDAAQTTGHVDIRDHGGVGDGVALTDAVTAAGSPVLTSASGLFTADMVGKTVVVLLGATTGNGTLVTTVASFQSPTQITMAAAAGRVSPIVGGPNVNAVVGTDNSAAFAAAFAEASAVASLAPGSSTYGGWNKRHSVVKPVFVPGGAYLTLTGVPTLKERGHALFGESLQSTLIWHVGEGPFLEMGEFDAAAAGADLYYGTASNLKVSNLSLAAPIYMGNFPTLRNGIGVQDNGSGNLSLDHVTLYGFKYGIFATCGSDFTEIGGLVTIESCNVGAYFGPGSQQVVLKGIAFGNTQESLVLEGTPHGTVVGCTFTRSAIADVTFEGATSGTTRGGLPYNVKGAVYLGPWAFYNTWFESFVSGTFESGPQHVWIKSAKAPADGIPEGLQGLSFRDCLLVSGGTQVAGETRAFIHDQGVKSADPLISNLVILGKRINGVYRYSGPDSTFSPVLDYYAYFPNDIVPFIGPSGAAAPVGTNMPGVITSPSTLTLDKTVVSNSNLVGTTVRGAEIVSTTETQTLTNKTLSRPKIQHLHSVANTNNVQVLQLDGPATAANYFQMNNVGAGGAPCLFGLGSDTNVPIMLRPKGTAPVQVYADAPATAARIVATSGTVLDLSLNLETKMAGVVQANGTQVEVKGHTHTVAQVTGARSWAAVPASSTAAGTAGQEAYDATWRYVCVTTGADGAALWKRTAYDITPW